MSSISAVFKEKKPLIPYLTAGDGDTLAFAKALIDAGASILELGMPFSDPTADGPMIRRAMERSLKAGTTLSDLFAISREVSKQVPVVLFSYANPLLAYGDALYKDAKASGVAAMLVLDMPAEEAEEHVKQCLEANIDPIFLISPSTSDERIKKIASMGRGFIYYVCQKGTTGVRDAVPPDLKAKIEQVRNHSKLPIAVGFGVSNKGMCEAIKEVADGVIVGSYFVSAIEQGKNPKALSEMAKALL